MIEKPLALIIEDDHQQTEIFTQALQLAGFIVEACSDGKNALDHLEDAVPYLVILDLNLPRVNGEQILAEIRRDPRLENTKVILATANPRHAEELRQQSDLVLIKPISFTQLKAFAERLHPSNLAQ